MVEWLLGGIRYNQREGGFKKGLFRVREHEITDWYSEEGRHCVKVCIRG